MKYELTKGHAPGGYTLGEGFMLEKKDNELTESQAAEYVAAGILKKQGGAGASKRKRGKS